jgi:hypothetical protein
MKICLVGDKLFHVDVGTGCRTDRQTDMTELIVALHNFANVPKKTPMKYKFKVLFSQLGSIENLHVLKLFTVILTNTIICF